jgi:hypothetical protein
VSEFIDVDPIPNPDRYGVEVPSNLIFGKSRETEMWEESVERIPLNIKDEHGSINLGPDEVIPMSPETNLSTILATEEGTSKVMDEEEVEGILEDAVSAPQEYTPEVPQGVQDLQDLITETVEEASYAEVEDQGFAPDLPGSEGVCVTPAWDSDHFPTADTYLKEMQETYAERGKVYGNSCLKAGKVLKAMIPEGVLVETEQDYAIMAVLGIMTHKMCRALNPLAARHKLGLPEDAPIHMSDLGHQDSIHDLSVYTAIWEELFIRAKGGK